ncbi:hypothetical protein CMI37_29240 [Candidatus Pacearchaeota archaeon]|nr:hypothetical protein [Candidatus Pacearchaeota archaeon]
MDKWPEECPDVPEDSHGWFRKHNEKILAEKLEPHHVVIELGSWLGKSTRFIADRCKKVYAIDHWEGGPEHHTSKYESIKGRLPKLYETFLKNCWSRKDKIIPLRMKTVVGLMKCSQAGIKPDIIYIDASHEYEDVLADISLSRELFPEALLIGDDWERKGVYSAVMNYAYDKEITFSVYGCVWWMK